MNRDQIIAQLDTDSSRWNIDYIANSIGNSEEGFITICDIVIENKYPVSARAARVMDALTEYYPGLLWHGFKRLSEFIPNCSIGGIKRDFMRMLTRYTFEEKHQGLVFDLSLSILENPKEPIAARAWAMTNLYNISNTQFDLKPELIAIFEDAAIDGSVGLQNRSKHLVYSLRKEINQKHADHL